MNFGRPGRIVAVLQWPLGVIMPFFAVFGRILFTGELGWLGVFGIFFSPVAVALLLLPPIVTLFDREARRLRSLRVVYAWATVAIWVALFTVSLTAPDSGDQRPYLAPLQVLTGVGADVAMSVTIGIGAVGAAGWLLALGVAITGIVRGTRTDGRIDSHAHRSRQALTP